MTESTESGWDDYVASDSSDTLDPLAGTSTDTLADQDLGTQAADYTYEASTDADWSDWNAATGDEAVTSAQSYFDSASEAAASGDGDLAAQWISDGNAQLDVAADSYSTASDYDASAASYEQGASDDLSTLSTWTGDADTATLAADSSAVADDYSAASSDYSEASADLTSYTDDSATDV